MFSYSLPMSGFILNAFACMYPGSMQYIFLFDASCSFTLYENLDKLNRIKDSSK